MWSSIPQTCSNCGNIRYADQCDCNDGVEKENKLLRRAITLYAHHPLFCAKSVNVESECDCGLNEIMILLEQRVKT